MSRIDQVPQNKIQPLTCLGNWLYGHGILGKEVKIVYSFADRRFCLLLGFSGRCKVCSMH
jgi:hypothetical protein